MVSAYALIPVVAWLASARAYRPRTVVSTLRTPPTTVPLPQRPVNELRVRLGDVDTTGNYPYVLGVLNKMKSRTCTASLIAPTWVLYAAHCNTGAFVQFGDMTVPYNIISDIKDILKTIPHPNYRKYNYETRHYFSDIGLMLIMELNLDVGKLSGVDYHSLMGYHVEYAGLGVTYPDHPYDVQTPVQIGSGTIASCRDIQEEVFFYPQLCVAPRCARRQSPLRGDSGAPLTVDGKIVGINVAVIHDSKISIFTPVSPFLSWIQETMNSI